MTEREALKLALEALKRATNYDPVIARAITAIKEALAQPEQKPEHVTYAGNGTARFLEGERPTGFFIQADRRQPEPMALEKTVCPFCSSEWVTAEQHDRKMDRLEQEPVAWMFQHEETGRMMFVETQQLEWGFEKGNPRLKKIGPLYTSPPQRKPLTDEEFRAILRSLSRQQGWDGDGWDLALKEAIEAAHGIKGEA